MSENTIALHAFLWCEKVNYKHMVLNVTIMKSLFLKKRIILYIYHLPTWRKGFEPVDFQSDALKPGHL